MTDNIINSTNSQKMSVYCKTCVCKSCEQVAWLEPENAELKAENERLKEEFKRLKESECIICKYSNIGDKYYQTLQEIKAIVKNICDGCTSECDCDEDCNYFLITEALTKAESEV